MAASDASPVYGTGPLLVTLVHLKAQHGIQAGHAAAADSGVNDRQKAAPPPKFPLLLAVPKKAGHYPVLLLQHGFNLRNSSYSKLMQHVASHGYIVVAPQMYDVELNPDATREIEHAAAVLNWLPEGLSASLAAKLGADAGVTPALEKVVLCGHSRGGKVAFALALGVGVQGGERGPPSSSSMSADVQQLVRLNSLVKIAGVVGLDPVDGESDTKQTTPRLVQTGEAAQGCFRQAFPVLIIGAGLANNPLKLGHQGFYECSAPPRIHVVARDYGHFDFLDDSVPWWLRLFYKRGPSPERFLILSGGLLVAFLKLCLSDDASSLDHALTHPLLPLIESQVNME